MGAKEFIKRPIREAVFSLGSYYHHLMASRPVWWGISNRSARRFWSKHRSPLASGEQSIVDSLLATGIAVTSFRDLFDDENFGELQRYALRRWNDPRVQAEASERARAPLVLDAGKKKKSFLVKLWAGPFQTDQGKPFLDLKNPFIRFSLSRPILEIVGSYLGLAPKFRDWRLEATVPSPAELRRKTSQRWHRDQEDLRLVKVFLYLNDVDESAGPFMYLERSQAGGRWERLFGRVPPRGSLPMPPDIDRHIPWDEVRTCTGPAGTLVFCDTNGLHQGGYATSRHRLMYTSIYTTAASPWPIRYAYPPDFRTEDLTALARFAVGNNPRQRRPKYFR